MKKITPSTMLCIMLFLVSACSAGRSTPIVSPPDIPPAQTYVLTDPSVPLEVAAGSEFYIAVPSNPSTGYYWQAMNSWDPNVFVTVATEYQSTSPEGVVGGGGMDIWRFDAIGAGEETLVLSYFPPGVTDSPEQTLTFTVRVK